MHTDYDRIEKAIRFLRENFKSQPRLDEVAAHVGLSSYHFQKMFTKWAGVSPKKFLQFISLEYAKQLLKKDRTLFDVSDQAGLSGTGRLHDLFVNIEAMTPGEYKNGGNGLTIHYSLGETPYGNVLIASTVKGVCHVSFINDRERSEAILSEQFPKAKLVQSGNEMHKNVLGLFHENSQEKHSIQLYLRGTPFQLKVWKALLEIPAGEAKTYGNLAENIGKPKAYRAVGSAVGKNPIAFIIPCHRVIASTGVIGNYRWGSDRKIAMFGREVAQNKKTRLL
ncbi:methylated-DNA--[protein]-cysteine S-methyltransferase [Rhodohalobacter halophilus]|uniref:methylated-DNA--[protein]-cysteine S-methyltransferase n=1 Tax=Rhodohalobacter halophilus TaxID=1812810 RepID=UPI00083FD41E|nr:methylated-DNA--[protein]-cysteine S-methyltransferase [Rhodohalobacter halophilus]